MDDDKAQPTDSLEAILAKAARAGRRPPAQDAASHLAAAGAELPPRSASIDADRLAVSLAAIVEKVALGSRSLDDERLGGRRPEEPPRVHGPRDQESPHRSAPPSPAALEDVAPSTTAAFAAKAPARPAGVPPQTKPRAAHVPAGRATDFDVSAAASDDDDDNAQADEARLARRSVFLRRSAVGFSCVAAAAGGWLGHALWVDRAEGSQALSQAASPTLPADPLRDAPLPTLPTPTELPPASYGVARAPAEAASAPDAPVLPPSAPAADVAGVTTSLGLVVDRDIDPGPWLLAELKRRIEPGSQTRLNLIPAGGWAASLVALQGQPSVALLRYDALQAARRVRAGAGVNHLPALEIVAPLANEAVYFVVRADSPLRFVHEIRNRSINVGPVQSGRALTAETAYRQMFGRTLPANAAGRLDETSALERLRNGKGIDVVIASGAQARDWLAQLSASDASQLKLLELDRTHPIGRRLVSAFLEMNVPPASLGHFPTSAGVTLSAMSFLVTAPEPRGSNSEHDLAIAALASAVCKAPLQAGNDRAWQSVDPSLRPEIGWPYSPVASAVFANCSRAGIRPAKAAASVPSTS